MSRPTKCIINLNKLKNNYLSVKKHCNNKVLALVKADAYGHGIIECAKVFEEIGADYLGVACLEEAEIIRNNNINTPILCLGPVPKGDEDYCVNIDADQTITCFDELINLEKACKKFNKTKNIHLKIDSGMHRIGVRIEDIDTILEFVNNSKYLNLKGVFTHFADSDSFDKTYTINQAEYFIKAVNIIKNKGVKNIIVHCSNSGALLSYPEYNFDMVRAGIILYGYYPSNEVDKPINVEPVLSFETAVIAINTILKGEKISYGCTYTAEKDMIVAVIPVGYGDGYKRLNSNKGYVLINNKKAKVVGRVCMDMTMVDVTDIPDVSIGDSVVLIGEQGAEKITTDDVACWCETISYEIPLSITNRVKKHYVD